MSASADTPPTDIQHNEAPQYQVLGTGDGNDGRFAQGMVLIDPATGAPYAATAGNASDTVAIHDTVSPSRGLVVTATGSAQITIPDGDDHATGATTDASTANTVIGRLKKLISLVPAALTGSGNFKVAVQEALPAGTNLLGTAGIDQTTDGTTNKVYVGHLPATPAGTNLVGKVGLDQTTPGTTNAVALDQSTPGTTNGVTVLPDATHGASYAACAAGATTTAKASAGVLKALAFAGTGTAGTVALVDGSTTIFTAGVPAAVGTWALSLPPEGVALATSVKVTTTGTGVTALAVYR